MFYRKIIFIVFFISIAASLYSLEFRSWGASGGVMYVRNSHDDGAPSPMLPYLGLATSFNLSGNNFLEPSLLVSWNYYLWNTEDEIALPAEIEYADSVLLINLLLDCPFVMKFDISETVKTGFLLSPAFILRIPIKTWGEGDSVKSDMMSFFYGGRFLFLEAGGIIEWNYSPTKSFKGRIDFLYPIYHIWDGGDKTDHLTIKVGIIFSFEKQRNASPETSAPVQAENIDQPSSEEEN